MSTLSTPQTTGRSQTPLRSGAPWTGFRYPSDWETDEDFMCIHFVPRSCADSETWLSMLSFWTAAIESYSTQLVYECPYRDQRKLCFSADRIEEAFTRADGMRPRCIDSILREMLIGGDIIDESAFIASVQQSIAKTSTAIDDGSGVSSVSSSSSSSAGMIWDAVSTVFDWMWSASTTDGGIDADYQAPPSLASVSMLENVSIDVYHLSLRGFDISDLAESSSFSSSSGEHSSSTTRVHRWPELITSVLCKRLRIGVKIQSLTAHTECLIPIDLLDDLLKAVFGLTSDDSILLRRFLQSRLMSVEFCSSSAEGKSPDMCKLTLFSKSSPRWDQSSDDDERDRIMITEKDQTDSDMIKMNLLIDSMDLEIELTEKRIKEKKLIIEQAMKEERERQMKSKRSTASSKVLSDSELKKLVNKNILKSQKNCLSLLKLLKARRDRLNQSRVNMEQVMLHVEDAKLNHTLFEAMNSAKIALNECKDKGPSVSEVNNMMSDLSGLMEETQAVSDALADTSSTMDSATAMMSDEDCEDEYRELEEALKTETLLSLPHPRALPSATAHESTDKQIEVTSGRKKEETTKKREVMLAS